MKEKIRKYWKDPVLSKLISVGIITIFSVLFNLIKSYFNNSSFFTEFRKFWSVEIKLWVVALLFLILFSCFLLIKLKNRKEKFFYDDETLELDKKLFHTIRDKLIDEDTVLNLKHNSFSGCPIDYESIDFSKKALLFFDNPSSEFINPELENLKKEFIVSLEVLDKMFFKYLFGKTLPSGNVLLSLPKEWELEKYKKAQDEMEKAENNTFEKYELLIKSGRRILKV